MYAFDSSRQLAAYNDAKQAATVKPSVATHLLTVCDKDVPNGLDANGACVISVPSFLSQIVELKLISTFFVNSMYNIDTHNNVFRIRIVDIAPALDSTFTVTITPKQYDGDSLATALQTALNADLAPRTFTVAFDSATYKLTFARTDGNGTFALVVDRRGDMYDQLGFKSGTWPSAGPNTTVTSTYPINLMGPAVVYVRLNQSSNRCVMADGYDYFAEIQLADNFQSRNTNTFVTNSVVYPSSHDLKSLQLQFFLDNAARSPWNFNNMPWRLTFELTGIV